MKGMGKGMITGSANKWDGKRIWERKREGEKGMKGIKKIKKGSEG
jgi:hypothetical protein